MVSLQGLFKIKKHDDLEAFRDITDDVLEQDFIPYACHFNPHTILTKNGELLQTIKITGFSYERIDAEAMDLRDTIRRAVLKNIPNNNYALWFHTIRRKRNFNLGGTYPDPFSQYVHEKWIEQNGWDAMFSNELYITIVRDGQSASLLDPGNFLRGLLPAVDRRNREAYLKAVYPELDRVTLSMLEMLKPFGARRLGLKQKDGVYYSEPCNFLGKIANLTDVDMPLPDIDISEYLTTQEVTFGFNAMEVRSHQGKRRFGAIMTMKEYKELSAEAIDGLMQLPIEFIISQCVDFVNAGEALKEYEFQEHLVELSGDKQLAGVSGLEDILKSNTRSPIDYGEQQLSIFLQADNLRQLEQYVKRAVDTLHELGIICVREDLKFEEAYWAQLPGNFEFVKRLKFINTKRIAGFANLNNFPAGRVKDNHWGDAITVFHTAAHTPYFFNFHLGDNGHTTVIGPPGGGKTVLINFLLAKARKYNNRLFLFDKDRTSELFIRAIGGNYWRPTVAPSSGHSALPPMNPCALADNDKNRRFLFMWLTTLSGHLEDTLNPEEARALHEAVNHLYTLPPQERWLGSVHDFLAQHAPGLSERLAPWLEGGIYAHFFYHREDRLDLARGVAGFELGDIMQEEAAQLPVFMTLLHRVMQTLDGTPTILVLKEAWQMLDNPLYATRIEGWLKSLTERNAMAILATEEVDNAASSSLGKNLMSGMATQIYLPDDFPSDAYRDTFGLTDREFEYLTLMDVADRHFLLKRGEETIVAELNLAGLNDIISILSGDEENLARMEGLLASRGAKPEQWLEAFLKEAA